MPQVKCGVCSKEFYIKPSHQKLGWGKFCSIGCRSKAQFKGKYLQCFICNKEVYRAQRLILRSKSGKFFCSKSCQTLWRNQEFSGEKSHNWKNGESAYRNVLKRNGMALVCMLCRNNDERVLTAHHKDHNRSNNKIENLTWLCMNCHYLVHHDIELDKQIMTS